MAGLRDMDIEADLYIPPNPPCYHRENLVEYKIHLNEFVCICGARRRLFGPNQKWIRRLSDIDNRR